MSHKSTWPRKGYFRPGYPPLASTSKGRYFYISSVDRNFSQRFGGGPTCPPWLGMTQIFRDKYGGVFSMPINGFLCNGCHEVLTEGFWLLALLCGSQHTAETLSSTNRVGFKQSPTLAAVCASPLLPPTSSAKQAALGAQRGTGRDWKVGTDYLWENPNCLKEAELSSKMLTRASGVRSRRTTSHYGV